MQLEIFCFCFCCSLLIGLVFHRFCRVESMATHNSWVLYLRASAIRDILPCILWVSSLTGSQGGDSVACYWSGASYWVEWIWPVLCKNMAVLQGAINEDRWQFPGEGWGGVHMKLPSLFTPELNLPSNFSFEIDLEPGQSNIKVFKTGQISNSLLR